MSKTHIGQLAGAADFLKTQYCTRWNIVACPKQSIAEHMYGVWVLVRNWGPMINLDHEDQRLAEEWALVHDLPEIRTGDAPTPHKTPEVKAWLEQIEHEIYPPLATIESCLRASGIFDLCKFCDTAESVLFLKLNGTGRHAADVESLLYRQMHQRLAASDLSCSQQQTLISIFEQTYAIT